MSYDHGKVKEIGFMETNKNGELTEFFPFGIESEIGRGGGLYIDGHKVGEWSTRIANVRIGRSGTKVHRGVICEGILDEDARVVNGYGVAQRKRKGEKIRLEPKNLCGASSSPRGGGRYYNWQGETSDEVNCNYCLKKMSENN